MASAQVTITQLPAAGPLTGDESVPIVQNGQTVQTTTGAIAVQPTQTQSFLTVNQETSLQNSQYLAVSSGLSLTNNGPQGTLQVNLTGTAASLNASGNGLIAKTATNTITPREIEVGTGLSVANGNGVSDNPLIGLGSFLTSIQTLSGSTGLVGVSGGAATSRAVAGTSNQISVANGDASAGNPTVSIADNPVLPGSQSVTVPAGGTSSRPGSPSDGMLRYNTDTNRFEAYLDGSWSNIGSGDGTVSSVSGTANQIAVADGTTTPVISIVSNPVLPGVASVKIPAGATSDRPLVPENGMIRYNTDTGLFEGYLTGSWISFASGSGVTSVATGTGLTGGPITSTGTISIDDTVVVTVDGVQTLENKTIDSPVITNNFKFEAAGIAPYTQFTAALGSWIANYNGYQEVYAVNQNNGSEASMDYVLYNDASDVNSYFIDMGMNSSNYTSGTYTIFTANSGYLFTGGGLSGQASDLFIGTSNAASDVIFFTGDVLAANARGRIKGDTGNFLLGTATDTGQLLQVNGTTKFSGASTFGSTVTLSANPTTALEAATKQYVDNAASTGIHIHTACAAETSAALSAVYTQGGTTFDITDITGTNTVVTSTTHGLSVNDEIWLTTTAGNGLSINTAYFVYSTPTTTSLQLSTSYAGPLLTGLTNATGLTYATRANSGVGAYLEASANQALPIADVIVGDRVLVYNQSTGYWNGVYTVTDLGSLITKWKLTRATDADYYSPADTDGLSEGDYFFIQSNSESYVLTNPTGAIIIGYDAITYTLFSSVPSYTGGTNIDVSGGVISLTGTVAATNGGTGTNTVTTGDLLYGSAANTWSKLALGVAYKSLTINASGTQVEWNAVALDQAAAVSGQLPIANGGTGLSSFTAGDLPYYASGTALSKLGIGTSTYILTSSGTAPQYTNPASITVGNATAAVTATNIAGGIASQIPYQTGAGTTSFIANGTSGQVLTSAGTSAPAWGGINGGTF